MEIKLRQATVYDVNSISDLFSSTIKAINSRDYNPHQIEIWSEVSDPSKWFNKISEHYYAVAESNENFNVQLVGFASLAPDGLVDFFFVHKDHQRKGIGNLLIRNIELNAIKQNIKKLYSEVSITARPFFEAMGFMLVKVFTKVYRETEFIDNLMEKHL